jgi:hypothetical protein
VVFGVALTYERSVKVRECQKRGKSRQMTVAVEFTNGLSEVDTRRIRHRIIKKHPERNAVSLLIPGLEALKRIIDA